MITIGRALTDYRLDGLSTRTFEHLVQTLALDAITSTVTPFGDGPDGGREATFNGLTKYGPASSHWDGYGVVQAKFLQRPKSTKTDGEWVFREVNKELRKYQKRRRGTKKLDYYIIATNVTLSAVEDSGSKDAVIRLLEDFKSCNVLKGFDIWDYDKLRILIDNNESVRRAYAAWITPGDVLMQLSDWLTEHRPDYHRLVVNYLQKELHSDQYAQLGQAGHTADEAIPLAQVFVDLPIVDHAYAGKPDLHPGEFPNFLSFLTEQAANRFVQSPAGDEIVSPQPGRFVLIGGPGQGKTTLGQYVCQVFRTSLLQDVPQNLLDPDVRRIIKTFKSMSDSGALTRPGARRFPLRVVLSGFAADLAEKKTSSLLTYLTDGFNRRTNSALTAQQFQALIVEYPSLLVLDGLDEVPASSNREQVLAAVQDFSIDVTSYSMDMLILATSRPQGYNEDFSPETYDHRWLVPLPLEKALEYGTKLAQVRFAGNSDRIQKIVEKLRRASETPATARIMRSPLQVTILTLLVDRRGQLPQEHWALFHEYYTMIYQRETERDIPAAAILREKKDDIDAVHRLVGLLLQVENEKSGRTDARLTTAQFSEIVEKYLVSEGNEGRALIELRDAIIEGAYIRLVFLVGLETGAVGFEIRPLQEFMAAECLLDADDGRVQNRLRAVAGNGNWRNVILFAVGKIFSERRYLRDTVESICIELNENTSDPASHLVYAGSELALDLLEDGPVAKQAAKSRSLTRLALKLLELDGSMWPRRLAGIYQENTRDIFEKELSRALSSLHAKTRSNTWICLAALIEAGADHLISLTGRALADSPPDAEAAVEMMATSAGSAPEWLVDVMAKTLPSINPADIQRARYRNMNMHVYLQRGARSNLCARSDWLDAAWEWVSPLRHFDKTKTLRIVDVGTNRLVGETSLRRIGSARSSRLRSIAGIPSDCHVCWELIRQIAAFEESPTKSRLVEVLRTASTISSSEAGNFILPKFTAWPLNECLLRGFWDTGWPALIEAVESGLLGDRADWERWENAWIAEGLKLADVCSDISHVLESGVANPWFPLMAGRVEFGGARWVDMSFIEETVSGTTSRVRQMLATAIAGSAFSPLHGQRVKELPPAFLEALLEVANSPSWQALSELMAKTRWSPPLDELWVSAISKGAQKSTLVGHYMMQGPIGGWLTSALRKFPEYHGLLVAIAQFRNFEIADDDIYRISRLPLDGELTVIRLSRAVIMLRAGRSLADVKADVDAVFGDAHANTKLLFDALISEDVPVDRQIAELLTVRKLATNSPVREALALSALRTSLRRRQSDLIDERRWVDLGFMNSLRDVMRSADA